jgi:hypothetical protein
MAPIRRYLRISRYSVLECRIFLENPADESRWLLSETDPALPRVFEAVKPFVLPKLREENERAKGKGKKKKSIKDVVKHGKKCLKTLETFILNHCSRRFRGFNFLDRDQHSTLLACQEQNLPGQANYEEQ